MKNSLVALLSLASLLISGTAFAGATRTDTVTVSPGATYAWADGQVTSARFSADTVQFIRCEITSYQNDASVFCQARSAAGTYLACSSDNYAHRV